MRRHEELISRGVWMAPYLGENGEIIVFSVRRDRRRVEERAIPPDSNFIAIGECHVGPARDGRSDAEVGARLTPWS
jgi:hypothetical protein